MLADAYLELQRKDIAGEGHNEPHRFRQSRNRKKAFNLLDFLQFYCTEVEVDWIQMPYMHILLLFTIELSEIRI